MAKKKKEKMIDKLTPEQEALFPVFREKWTKIGLSCEPLDFERAKECANMAYEAANLPPPGRYLVTDSPLSCALVAAEIISYDADALKREISDRTDSCKELGPVGIVDTVYASAVNSLVNFLYDALSLDESVPRNVVHNIVASKARFLKKESETWPEYMANHFDTPKKLTKSQREAYGSELRYCVNQQLYGSHDAGWLSFYDYFWEVLHLDCIKPLLGLIELTKVCGWWAPYRELAIFQHRHTEVHRNDRDQLHCENGPAIAYRDGFAVWVIGGVIVDKQIVMAPETQTLEQMNKEQNEEVKRIRIERFGWDRYLKESNAKLIDRRSNAVENTKEALMEANGMRCLVCACPSTGRIYSLEVPPDTKTCEAAQKWLWQSDTLKKRFKVKVNILGRS